MAKMPITCKSAMEDAAGNEKSAVDLQNIDHYQLQDGGVWTNRQKGTGHDLLQNEFNSPKAMHLIQDFRSKPNSTQ